MWKTVAATFPARKAAPLASCLLTVFLVEESDDDQDDPGRQSGRSRVPRGARLYDEATGAKLWVEDFVKSRVRGLKFHEISFHVKFQGLAPHSVPPTHYPAVTAHTGGMPLGVTGSSMLRQERGKCLSCCPPPLARPRLSLLLAV